jgi:hypothetical protein
MESLQRPFAVLAADNYCAADAVRMLIFGVAVNFLSAAIPGPITRANLNLREHRVTVKFPRLRIRKSTRATLGGLMIGAASLYALSMAYDEARDNLLLFFISIVLMLLAILIIAMTVVAGIYGIRKLFRKLLGRKDVPDDTSN